MLHRNVLLMLENRNFQRYSTGSKKCGHVCTVCAIIFGFVALMSLLAIFAVDMTQRVYIVYLDSPTPKYITDEKFLSIALDTSIIENGFRHFPLNDPKIQKMMRALVPAYLRVGGTMADRLTFSNSLHFKHASRSLDGGECAYEGIHCDYLEKPNFTMNAEEWLNLNRLAEKTNLKLIFDLNALKRFDNGSWNYENAEKLISFSNKYNFDINWELGNEPNAFRHEFNYEVSAAQMAKDFQMLRKILEKYPKYKNSLLVGPDVTRPVPNNNASEIYLEQFISEAGHVIDAVTFHQYYFNGATAKISDFLNPDIFDMLQWQISIVKKIVQGVGINKPIWLGETSSAYGGGAPRLSNRFIATFLWLDKLGLAAKNGLSVVIRQSIFQGHYALINDHYLPTPDWWVSVLYKKLVGNKVVDCQFYENELLRLYCQCTPPRRYFDGIPSVTVFGMNLNNRKAKIRFEGVTPFAEKNLRVDAYILTTSERIDSRFIYLNDQFLVLSETGNVPNLLPKTVVANPYVVLPPYSLAFWVVPISNNAIPYC